MRLPALGLDLAARRPRCCTQSLGGVTDDEIDKITHLNAMRHFHYDPFAHIPREQATVAALRAEARDWDISLKSIKHLRPAGASSAQAF